MREQHYPSGARHMPIENDFTRAYGAIKELEGRVERLEDSASKPFSVTICEANDQLIDENNQLRFVLSILAAVKDDGWIEWHGGEGVITDLKFRDRVIATGYVNGFNWNHTGNPGDIIAYRIAR